MLPLSLMLDASSHAGASQLISNQEHLFFFKKTGARVYEITINMYFTFLKYFKVFTCLATFNFLFSPVQGQILHV